MTKLKNIYYVINNEAISPCGRLLTKTTKSYYTLWKCVELVDVDRDEIIDFYSVPVKINLWGSKLEHYKNKISYYGRPIKFERYGTF